MSTTNIELFFRESNWNEALRQSRGYEDSELVDSYVKQIKENPPWIVEKKKVLTTREVELICAIQRSIKLGFFGRNNLNVLDIGGGNGYLGFAVRHIISEIGWDWTILESDICAKSYSEFEKDAGVRWVSDNQHDWNKKKDIGLLSCVLQYLEKPDEYLVKIAKQCDFMILMRLPLADFDDHVVTRQTFLPGLHPFPSASWPCWFFSRKMFDDLISKIGKIVYQWTSCESILFEGNNIRFEGVCIKSF